MTQFYRYMCLGLAGLMVLGMIVSLGGVIFNGGQEDADVNITVSSLLDGSFLSMLEEIWRTRFPGQAFWQERYRSLCDWYNLVDRPGEIE